MEKCGDLGESALGIALGQRPSLEVARRASTILEDIERGQAAGQLKRIRALEVLEHLGTPEARRLLEDLAKGVPEARLTQEAKASLRRLTKRPADKP